MSSRKERQRRHETERREAIRSRRIRVEDPNAQTVIDGIYDAFEGVDRMRAISWDEAYSIDGYGLQRGRFPDDDATWEQLVEDPRWYGQFAIVFLDTGGFRYYLPPAMIRNLRGDHRVPAELFLRPSSRSTPDFPDIDRWEEFDRSQVQAIGRFVDLMSKRFPSVEWTEVAENWRTYVEEREAR